MGASGALAMALVRRRLSLSCCGRRSTPTAKLTRCGLHLVGARVFTDVLWRGRPLWVEHLLLNLPGGQLGFLIVVNVLVFLLAFFLDFFELASSSSRCSARRKKLGVTFIWFGVLLGVNMQTSFMHPPFGFALFYLAQRGTAKDFIDRISGRRLPG